jgi:hypothetical protein
MYRILPCPIWSYRDTRKVEQSCSSNTVSKTNLSDEKDLPCLISAADDREFGIKRSCPGRFALRSREWAMKLFFTLSQSRRVTHTSLSRSVKIEKGASQALLDVRNPVHGGRTFRRIGQSREMGHTARMNAIRIVTVGIVSVLVLNCSRSF